MTYNHISKEDRRRIEALTQVGNSNKAIAAIIGVSASTIGRELKRNGGYGARCYDCERAQKLAEKRRKDSKEPKISEKTWRKVFALFNLDLSPEQIASVVKISHESIYRRIYAEIRAGRLDRKHLRWGRKKRRRRLPKRPPRDPSKLSIENRPDLSSRAEFGHWEGDTVELVRGQSYLVTMVERKTRFLMVKQVPNKKADTVRNAILSIFWHFPQAVKSITLDNGTEFSDHKTIANCLNAPVYFAHPHCPWERGTNENTNRLLRQYFPKKTKATYTAAYLADCRQKLNTRPRKCLGFASPASRFFFELRGLHFRVELTSTTNFYVIFVIKTISY